MNDKLALMRDGGASLGVVLQELVDRAVPGVSLLALDQYAEKRVRELGGTPSFQTVKGYQWTTCLCVNDVVVHGIPTTYSLVDGDILTIDVGMVKGGYHTDTAWTLEVGHGEHAHRGGEACREAQVLLDVGKKALDRALSVATYGNRIGHISAAIQECIEGAGYSIVHSLVGHGVGKQLHEDPQIPGFLRGSIEKTQKLAVGMTIAIEVIYAKGKGSIVVDESDGWTIRTRDGSLASVFEQTIAIGEGSAPEVLTPAPH